MEYVRGLLFRTVGALGRWRGGGLPRRAFRRPGGARKSCGGAQRGTAPPGERTRLRQPAGDMQWLAERGEGGGGGPFLLFVGHLLF